MQEQQQWHHIVNVTELENLKRKIEITYDVEGVEMAFNKSIDLVGKKVQIKGFRRGKAPKNVVQAYCKKEIESSVLSLLSHEGYLHACFEHKIKPISEPDVKFSKINNDGTFSCEIEVETSPEINLEGYVGLQIYKQSFEDFKERFLENIKSQVSETYEKDNVDLNDVILIDYEIITVDKNELVEKKQNVKLLVKEEIPFGKDFVGMEKDKPKKFVEALSENDFKEFAGQEANIVVTVKEIYGIKQLNNDEIAKKLNLTVEQLEQETVKEYEKNQRMILEEQIIDQLLKNHDFEVPNDWVNNECNYLVKKLGIVDSKYQNEIKNIAERNVKRTFILDSIYDAEQSLKVTKQDLDKFLSMQAMNKGGTLQQEYKNLKKQENVSEITSFIKNQKIMNFLLENAEIQEKNDELKGE